MRALVLALLAACTFNVHVPPPPEQPKPPVVEAPKVETKTDTKPAKKDEPKKP